MSMEYVYGAMLLHEAKQQVTEETLKKVVEASGVKFDQGVAKALVTSLQNVDIEKAISEAAVPAAAAPAAQAGGDKAAEKKKDDKKEAEEKEAAVAGLGALFG